MHDGSFETLEAVIDHYAKGGEGHQLQDPVIQPFSLTKKERSALLAFLLALTDLSFAERL